MTASPSHPTAGPEPAPGAAAWAALLQSLPDLAWLKDRECRYVAINDAFLRQLRSDARVREGGETLERERVVGRTDGDLFPAILAEEYRSYDLRVQQQGSELRARVQTPYSDGTSRWFDLTLTPLRDGCGRVLGTLGTARASAEPADPADPLEARVAAAVHELSNPLNSILNFAQLLLLDPRPADDEEALQAIRREAERAAEVVSALRDLLAGRGRGDPGAPLPPPAVAVRPLRILLVDDEAAIRVPVQRYLQRRGHRVDAAADGAEALARVDAAAGSRFDLVLCDLRMPGLAGDRLLDRLAERDPGLLERVVFLTGDAEDDAFQGALRRAAAPPILKPIQLPALAGIIEAFGPRHARPT